MSMGSSTGRVLHSNALGHFFQLCNKDSNNSDVDADEEWEDH